MKGNTGVLLLVSLLLLVSVSAFQHFRDRIPNGHRIKHPCKANFMWYGVGHMNEKGGGQTNPFGKDFEKYGFEWNECLCKEDSDLDGQTNGEELGDPDCQWKPGQDPAIFRGITHPGVCEPVNSTFCQQKNTFLSCAIDSEFNCDAVKEEGVEALKIQLDETAVPADHTSYYCQSFEIPTDKDYHMIATSPLIDNQNVMHHMILSACEDYKVEVARQVYQKATPCGMTYCTNIIGAWGLGTGGVCYDDAMGYRLGKNGYKLLILELHWNNPELRSDYTDGSGLNLFITDKLRPYDGGVWFIGPSYLQIPPGFINYENQGGCPTECVDYLLEGGTVNMTHFSPHMHYLGSTFKFEQIRNNQVVRRFDVDQFYYDDPELTKLKEHIEVRPGDSFKVVCGYSSKTKGRFIYYGDETSNEMCYAIFAFYPYKPNINFCEVTEGFGSCGRGKRVGDPDLYCNYTDFLTVFNQHLPNIKLSCDDTGLVCRYGCEAAMALVKEHPCYTSPAIYKLRNSYDNHEWGRKILNMLSSCDPKPVLDPGNTGSNTNARCDIPKPPTVPDDLECGSGSNGYGVQINVWITGLLMIICYV